MGLKQCKKCLKTMDEEKNFYKKRDGSRVDLCKKCLTLHLDNFKEDTFTWILQEMDYPYIPSEWNVIRNKQFAKNPNLEGTSVLGKYLSKMKLSQYSGKGWEDSKALIDKAEARSEEQLAEQRKYEDELRQRFENNEISEAQYKTLMSEETQNDDLRYVIPDVPDAANNRYGNKDDYIDPALLQAQEEELTDEDLIYLALKWGREYKKNELIALEKDYKNMEDSFDVQDADTINTLKLLCKTNLKMNQAIDEGDVEGFQKLSKVSEGLRKTAKFTAAQNKEDKNDFVDSVGELVSICERQGFIPRYVTDAPQDVIDTILKDMNNYVRKLVTQDLGFGQQIEDAIKKIQLQQEENQQTSDDLFEDEENQELTDEDFKKYYDNLEEQKSLDEEVQ